MSKRIKIPKRDKGKYEYIRCSKCDRFVYDNCNLTNKKIGTCQFKHRHRFMLRYYVPNSGSKYIVKTFDTKDYNEFKELAAEFIKSFDGGEFEKIAIKPTIGSALNNDGIGLKENSVFKKSASVINITFKSVFLRYVDYLYGVNVPAHKYKPKDDKTIKGYIKGIKIFKEALKEYEVEVGDMLVTEIGDVEVGYFHEFLSNTTKDDGSVRFSSRSYNHRIAQNKAFFNYIKDNLGINMTNPFDEMRQKYVKRKNFTIALFEFEQLLKTVTKENGLYKKYRKDRVTTLNHYRPWMKDAYKLALFTGERRDGIVLMKWSFVDMKERIITIPNYKVNRITEIDRDRLIPITTDLYKLLTKLGAEKHKGSDQYIFLPKHQNRNTIKTWISNSFTHFWKKNDFNPEITFRHLRKTYVTLIYSQFGDKTRAVTDQNVDTILEYYLNKKSIVSQAKNISLYDLEDRIKND
jgi:integrase